MAFPSPVSRTGYVSSSTNSTSWAAFSGITVAVGELLIFIVGADGLPTLTTSSTGWTKLAQRDGAGGDVSAIFYKIATGTTESFTLSSTASEQYNGILYRISGADSLSATSTVTSGSRPDPPSHDAGAVRDHLWITAAIVGTGNQAATAAPTGYSNLTTRAGATTSTAATAISVADKTANSQTDNPGIFTTPSSLVDSTSWTIAVWSSAPAGPSYPIDLGGGFGFREPGTYSNGGASAATPGLPGGWAENDLFVLDYVTDGGAGTHPTVSGWTAFGTPSSYSNGAPTFTTAYRYLYRRLATASESAPTLPDSGANNQAQIFAYTGVLTSGDPIDASAINSNGTSGTALSATGVTTATANALVVVDWALGSPSISVSGWDNSVTEDYDDASSPFKIGTKVQATAGSTGTTTATISASNRYNAATFALKPAVTSTTYDDTLAEAATPDQTATASATFPNTRTETATAADTVGSAFTMMATQSDGTTLTEALAGGLLLAGAYSESATVADSATIAFTLTAARAESITANDNLTAAQVFASTLTEAATAGDGTGTASTWPNALSEALTANDSLTGAMVILRTLAESVTATDSAATAHTMLAALTEAATVADAYSAGAATYSDTLSETVTLAASLAAGMTLLAAYSEGATLAAAQTAAQSLATALAEAATLATGQAAGFAFNSSLNEDTSPAAALQSLTAYGVTLAEAIAANDDSAAQLACAAILDEAATLSAGDASLHAAGVTLSEALTPGMALLAALIAWRKTTPTAANWQQAAADPATWQGSDPTDASWQATDTDTPDWTTQTPTTGTWN